MLTDDYPNDLQIADALQIYFGRYHFANGGYHDKYFRIKLGRLYLPFPNTKARLRAVKVHDLHHLLTGYNALWKGEIEIAAWEVASGCGNYFMAWFFNIGSFGLGLFLFPRALFTAFMMGRHVRTNLYYNYEYKSLLRRTVAELRQELGIGTLRKNSTADYVHFMGWTFLAILLMLCEMTFCCFVLESVFHA